MHYNKYGKRIRKTYGQRKREMERFYDANPQARNGSNWAVIQCYHRAGLTLQDTAEVLHMTEEQVKFALDIIQQNAQ